MHRFVGASLIIISKCESSHTSEWMSSPTHKNAENHGIPAINLLFASSVLLSGNNFEKVNLLTDQLGLKTISSTTYHLYQRMYMCPGIESFYTQMQLAVLESLRAKTSPLILAGVYMHNVIFIGWVHSWLFPQVMAGMILLDHLQNTVLTR